MNERTNEWMKEWPKRIHSKILSLFLNEKARVHQSLRETQVAQYTETFLPTKWRNLYEDYFKAVERAWRLRVISERTFEVNSFNQTFIKSGSSSHVIGVAWHPAQPDVT